MEEILNLLDTNLETFENELLPPVETEAARTTRQNLSRIVQLRPGSKRKRNNQITRQVEQSKIETKRRYRQVRVEIEANCANEKTDHPLVKIMPILIKYLTIDQLGKMAQVGNRQLAEAIYYDDYEWRNRFRASNLMPLSNKFKIHRGYEQYKLAVVWSSRQKSNLVKLGRDKDETFGTLKIVHDRGDAYYTANGAIMKENDYHVAFDEASKSKISAFAVSRGKTIIGTTTGSLFVMAKKNKFQTNVDNCEIRDI